MNGTVQDINEVRGMVAVLTDEGTFSVLELLARDSVEVGDVVSWNDAMALGTEVLTNHTRGERFEAYFQNHHVPPAQLRQQLLY